MNEQLRVLIIDDSKDDADLLVRRLRTAFADIQWTHVSDSAGILAEIERQPWDVIISDYSVPGVPDLYALAAVRERALHVPVIIVSGVVGEERVVETIKQGACDYVMKDNLTRLVPAVKRSLSDRAAWRRQQQAEDALRRSREDYHDLVENINDVVFKLDEAGRLTYVNTVVRMMAGYEPHEVIGCPFAQFVHPDDLAALQRSYRDVLQHKLSPSEFRLRARDGSWRWVRTSSRPIVHAGTVAGIQGVMVDLTERKHMDDALIALNTFSVELAGLPADADIGERIAHRLRELTGAEIAMFNAFFPADRVMAMSRMDAAEGVIGKITRALGKPLTELRVPVSEEAYRDIVTAGVKKFDSMTDISFGAVPRAADAAIKKLLGLSYFVGVSYVVDGSLYGASLLAFKGHVPEPSRLLLGSFAHMVAVAMRRRAAEAALEKHEEQMRTILENLPDVVFMLDADGRVLMVNEIAARFLGKPRDAIVGQHQSSLFPPEDAARNSVNIGKVLDSGVLFFEDRMMSVPGRNDIWVETLLLPLKDASGRTTAVLGVLHDVTKRKRAEQELARQKSRAQLAMDIAQLVGWEYDALTGRFLFNEPYYALYGTTVEREGGLEMSAQRFAQRFVHPEDAPLVATEIEKALTTADPQYTRRFEARVFRTDGEERQVAVSLGITKDHTGRTIGLFGTNQDITERKRLEATLLQSQKMGAIGQLAGGIAHDFNNILNIIIGFSDIALRSSDAGGGHRLELDEIKKSAKRAAALTSQLLSFSRRQPLFQHALSLNDVVKDMESMLRRLIGEDIRVRAKLDPGLRLVFVDRSQQEQVIMNLVINAKDAMPGGGTVTIRTENVFLDAAQARAMPDARPGAFVCLSVADTGMGMDRDVLAHVFEPFFTTKGVGKGTGLGLAVIYGIIKQHEGWITVASAPGQGTTFAVYLPVHEGSADRCDLPETMPEKSSHGRGERILMVEDEQGILDAVVPSLRQEGYVVHAAIDARQAEEIFRREEGAFDLLLTDAVMPGKSGLDLARDLVSRSPSLKVLVSSGHLEDKARLSDRDGKKYYFLPKPYETVTLLSMVRHVLDTP